MLFLVISSCLSSDFIVQWIRCRWLSNYTSPTYRLWKTWTSPQDISMSTWYYHTLIPLKYQLFSPIYGKCYYRSKFFRAPGKVSSRTKDQKSKKALNSLSEASFQHFLKDLQGQSGLGSKTIQWGEHAAPALLWHCTR